MTQQEIANAINCFADDCHDVALDHGFWDSEVNNGEKLALMHSELSELLERLRSSSPAALDEHCQEFKNCEVELADLIIRALDFASYHQYRIGEALVAKFNFNKSRPRMHGKRF